MCDICDEWYHAACHNIQSQTYSKLGHSSTEWYCFERESNIHNTHDYNTHPSDIHYIAPNSSLPLDSIQSISYYKETSNQSLPHSQTYYHLHTWSWIINIVNCQSLVGKKGQLSHLPTACWPDVIIATETWRGSDVKDSELECDNYAVYRRDRMTGLGGGVLIAISNAIKLTLTAIETNSLGEH